MFRKPGVDRICHNQPGHALQPAQADSQPFPSVGSIRPLHSDPATESPFFLGHLDETGTGNGEGRNLNLSLASAASVAQWFATLDLGGPLKCGPDGQRVQSPDNLAVDPARGAVSYTEVRRHWPGWMDGAPQPSYAGIRLKLHSPGGPAADLVVQGPANHRVAGLVHLFGIESPVLTVSLAIGLEVVSVLSQ